MPRIPGPQDLQYGVPSNTRRVIQVTPGGVGPALQQMGEVASELAAKVRKQRDEAARAHATLEAQRAALEVERSLQNDLEPEDLPERGVKALEAGYAAAGKRLKPRLQQAWGLYSQQKIEDHRSRLYDLQRRRGTEVARGELAVALQSAQQTLADPTLDPDVTLDTQITVDRLVDQAVTNGAINPEQAARFKGGLREYTKKVRADHAVAQIEGRLANPSQDPQAILEDLEAGAFGPYLDATQREKVATAVLKEQERRAREAEIDGRRRQTEAKTELRALVSEHIAATAAGVEITDPIDINAISQVLGEATALRYAASVGQASTVAQMRVAPASSLIEMTKPQPQAGDARTTLAQTIASEAATKVLTERREDPIGAAIKARLLPAVDDLAPMFAEGRVPSTFSEVAKRRVAFFEAAGEEFGATQLELFTRQEAEALQGAYTRATPNARLQLLRELAVNSGGGPKALRAVARALNSPAASYALAVMNKGREGAAAAAAVIEGERLLNPPADETGKKAPGYDLPPGLDAEWANYVGSAYTQSRTRDLAETAKANFHAIYASLARGKPGVLDADAAEEAARLAAGPVLRYSGRDLLLPLGTNPGEFAPLLKSAIRDTLEANKLLGGLGEYDVENAGGRRFYLVRGGAPVRVNGQPVLVDVPLAPAKPARTQGSRLVLPRG